MSVFLNRKSVRNYDKFFKITTKELNEILTIALRAPSSMNLQPTKMLVVQSEEAKEKIRPHLLGNQLQLDTASALIILATDTNKFISGIEIFNEAEKQGFIPKDVADRQRQIIGERHRSYQIDKILNEGHLDAGLLAMQLMLVAKEFGYDTCPIAGFKKETILSALDITDDNLYPVLIVSIGKAKEPGYNSYRLNVKDVVKYY